MKTYKFSELNKEAKHIAVLDYIKGWEETHPIGDMPYQDAYSSCIDTDNEIDYDQNGEQILEKISKKKDKNV
jgi:hypothetical protein